MRGCEHRSMASCCVLQGILGKWQGQYSQPRRLKNKCFTLILNNNVLIRCVVNMSFCVYRK